MGRRGSSSQNAVPHRTKMRALLWQGGRTEDADLYSSGGTQHSHLLDILRQKADFVCPPMMHASGKKDRIIEQAPFPKVKDISKVLLKTDIALGQQIKKQFGPRRPYCFPQLDQTVDKRASSCPQAPNLPFPTAFTLEILYKLLL